MKSPQVGQVVILLYSQSAIIRIDANSFAYKVGDVTVWEPLYKLKWDESRGNWTL
jgi:hypothetical protein